MRTRHTPGARTIVGVFPDVAPHSWRRRRNEAGIARKNRRRTHSNGGRSSFRSVARDNFRKLGETYPRAVINPVSSEVCHATVKDAADSAARDTPCRSSATTRRHTHSCKIRISSLWYVCVLSVRYTRVSAISRSPSGQPASARIERD